MREITLVCSAAATGLSQTAEKIGALKGIEALDLEDILKREVVDWSLYSGGPRTMGTLCSRSDRDTVLGFWTQAFDGCMAKLAKIKKSKHVVLACHLTLFSPSRLEFYSPPLLRELSKRKLRVQRVIVLIDDIYDMHARLADADNLYPPDAVLKEHELHASRLTGPIANESVQAFDEDESASLAVEITIKNLLRLLHWRRSEMVAAEELARNLDCPLTVLAVKHELESLVSLVEDPKTVPAYLSHKITELRQANLKSEAAGDPERWPELAAEINSLAAPMRSNRVVLIQPTAIDELRFERNLRREHRLDRYAGELASRWPVPSSAMYVPPPVPEAPRYKNVVSHGLHKHDRYRHGLFALLQHSIYDEIAFRDHLLVSCNPALLVYRPTAINPRMAGGVEAEIQHWASATRQTIKSQRPAAFVHVADELVSFVDASPVRQRELALSAQFGEAMGAEFNPSEVDAIWMNAVQGDRAIGEVFNATSVHLRRLGPGGVERRFDSALQQTACALISVLCRVRGNAISKAVHFVAIDSADSRDPDFLQRVARYLREPSVDATEAANAHLAASLQSHMGATSVLDLVRKLAGYSVR